LSSTTGQQANDPRALIASHQWWHTIEIAPGVITPGAWDLRAMADRVPWPESLDGARCLDIGTMDGFWAFEMERRGAADVLAIDLTDPSHMDVPAGLPAGVVEPGGETRGTTFRLAAQLLGSAATWRNLSVYDLSETRAGRFDLVFLGYTLNLLRNPIGALEAIRSVCNGALIVVDEVSLPLSVLHRQALARLASRPAHLEWWVFNRAGLRRAIELAGFRPDAESRLLQYKRGPGIPDSELSVRTRLRFALGLAGTSLAIRATPL
jgi:tRNA (mo5U34)-methyltransferase